MELCDEIDLQVEGRKEGRKSIMPSFRIHQFIRLSYDGR